MTEFFGSVPISPMWPAAPFAGFGSLQYPSGFGSSPVGATAEGFAPAQLATASPSLPPVGQSFATPGAFGGPQPAYGFAPQAYGFGHFPAIAGYEVPPGITASGLLAAVAMRRRQPFGPTNDREIEEFLYEALDLLPGSNDVEVQSEGGRVTITGTVPHKRLKHDVGEIAWAMVGVNDVANNVNIAARRRQRTGGREEPGQSVPTRKQP